MRRRGQPDPQAVETLRHLPLQHRRQLVAANQIRARRVETQLEALAIMLPPEQMRDYANMYLDGNGSTFAWHKFEEVHTPSRQLVGRLVQRRQNLLSPGGARPELVPGEPPVIHRVLRYGTFDVLEYAAKDGQQTVLQNHDQGGTCVRR
jgi:hypothetical protein